MPSERGEPAERPAAGARDMKRPTPQRPALPPPLPLAHGELGEQDALELRALKEQIRDASGLFCEGYKEKCLRRRLAVRMRARGVHSYADYAALLDSDPAEYQRLIDTVTINVSKFYRNPEVWNAVAALVLPDLFGREGPLRAWSAGTATGEEPYTLAMLVRDYLDPQGRTREAARIEIIGSDIDADALEKARHAAYPELALVETPADARARWFEPGGPPFRVRDEIRRMVRFERADLIREPVPDDLDLVFCRNLFIYFERELQEDLLSRFVDALRPGGWLVLGKVETLLGPAARRLEVVRSRERIYRKR
jgi:chemotaxis methyl-accepting protein methylase